MKSSRFTITLVTTIIFIHSMDCTISNRRKTSTGTRPSRSDEGYVDHVCSSPARGSCEASVRILDMVSPSGHGSVALVDDVQMRSVEV